MSKRAAESPRSLGALLGFDGSVHAVRALQWGAQEALLRGVGLEVVVAFTTPPVVGDDIPLDPEDVSDRHLAEQAAQKAREMLKDYPGESQVHIVNGDPTDVLAARSSGADVTVVGARGRGGVAGLLLGSVASALPARADCPVVIVNQHFRPRQDLEEIQWDRVPVVVGIDGSKGSKLAALQAAEVAAARQAPLGLIAAVSERRGSRLSNLRPGAGSNETARRRSELEHQAEAQMQWLSGHFSNLIITSAVITGQPVEVLKEESAKSQLLVVGTRGRGAMAGTLLGSVSRGVIMHALSPVMVVPDGDDPRMND